MPVSVYVCAVAGMLTHEKVHTLGARTGYVHLPTYHSFYISTCDVSLWAEWTYT